MVRKLSIKVKLTILLVLCSPLVVWAANLWLYSNVTNVVLTDEVAIGSASRGSVVNATVSELFKPVLAETHTWTADQSFVLGVTPSADLTANFAKIQMTVDSGASNTSVGQPMYIASDGELDTADSDGSSTFPAFGLLAQSGVGTKTLVFMGPCRNDDAWNWTPGLPVYLSDTPGVTTGLTQVEPGTGEHVQVVGMALTADVVFVIPFWWGQLN